MHKGVQAFSSHTLALAVRPGGSVASGGRQVIRILIAERLAVIRAGLVASISRERDIEVVAELDQRGPLLSAVSALRPDVAIIDDGIARHDEFAIVRTLREATPLCRVLILGTKPHPRDLNRAVEADATGFMLKDSSPERISEAVRQVAKGNKAIDPDLAFAAIEATASPLSPRERDVLRLAAQGAPTAEIADQLCLAIGTVRNYMSNIIVKTGARNRVDAIRIADRSGWL